MSNIITKCLANFAKHDRYHRDSWYIQFLVMNLLVQWTEKHKYSKEHTELTAGYLKKLKTAINKHLKKIDDKTNFYDIAKHLDELKLTNSRIIGYQQFIDVIEKHVADHSAAIDVSGPTSQNMKKRRRDKKQYDEAIQDKALSHFAYLRSNFHLQAYVVAALEEKGIIGTQSQLSPKTIKAMDALIFKHNTEHHWENINKWTSGK